ncbi:hypothetical protein AciPR4_2608 [Terriglobus saanensis SP1PR4]|uniref:Uncharacterized protein n=1 Tax=Terriglobus saanensis (strain ATCC BAA-1853 / DSM 23119 / SP1PR4) TaxID=401053 RepID=E8V138_TERSS|nr:hypothetical protein AciPR4_2608 [Terriglobus saanensis SP1PR4]
MKRQAMKRLSEDAATRRYVPLNQHRGRDGKTMHSMRFTPVLLEMQGKA